MKNLSRSILVQFLMLSLVWNPAFGQQVGQATQDIAAQEKYKDFVHQATTDKFEEECAKNNCKNPGPTKNGLDIVSSYVATLAMGLLVGDAVGTLISGAKSGLKNLFKKKDSANSVKTASTESTNDTSQLTADDTPPEMKDTTTTNTTETGNTETGGDKSNSQESDDQKLGKICKIVASAGVLALTLTDLLNKNKIGKKYSRTTRELAQADALYTIANNHESIKKSNNTKGTIMAVVTACYTAAGIAAIYAESDKVAEYFLYAGLAGSLMTISFISAGRHKKTEKQALASARSIPKKGDCHPGTPCFCAENAASSEENHNALYEANCVADELQNGDTRNMAMVCLDANGQSDATCACRASNTCLDASLNQQIRNIDMDPGLRNNLTDAFSIIAKGEISSKNFNKLKNMGTHFQKVAAKNSDKIFDSNKLGSGDPAIAKALNASGMSKGAALLASSAKLSASDKRRLASLTGTTQVSKFARSKKRSRSRVRATKQPDFNIGFNANDLMKQLKTTQTAELDPAAKLEKYKRIRAEKRAMAMAEINPMENEPIFNIISQRYLKSGFVRLEN